MKIFLAIAVLVSFMSVASAQKQKNTRANSQAANQERKVIYTYKKYEKLDFDDLVIEGDSNSYGELSVSPMKDMSVRNKLPYRKNFNEQIRKGISRVR